MHAYKIHHFNCLATLRAGFIVNGNIPELCLNLLDLFWISRIHWIHSYPDYTIMWYLLRRFSTINYLVLLCFCLSTSLTEYPFLDPVLSEILQTHASEIVASRSTYMIAFLTPPYRIQTDSVQSNKYTIVLLGTFWTPSDESFIWISHFKTLLSTLSRILIQIFPFFKTYSS